MKILDFVRKSDFVKVNSLSTKKIFLSSSKLKASILTIATIILVGCSTYETNSFLYGTDYANKAFDNEFHTILGSDLNGWSIAKVNLKVTRDIKVDQLRIREVSLDYDLCTSGRISHLELDGKIGPDSTEMLRRIISNLPQCISTETGNRVSLSIYMNSSGGFLSDGFKLGELIRKEQMTTELVKGQTCASACAIAFIGGKYRVMQNDAVLLFHAPYTKNLLGVDCSDNGQIKPLRSYFLSMLGEQDGEFVFKRNQSYCSSTEGWTVNTDAAKLLGITTR